MVSSEMERHHLEILRTYSHSDLHDALKGPRVRRLSSSDGGSRSEANCSELCSGRAARSFRRQNLLTDLPTSVCSLVSLTSLDASENHLQAVPEDLGQLQKLQTLLLSNNEPPVSSLMEQYAADRKEQPGETPHVITPQKRPREPSPEVSPVKITCYAGRRVHGKQQFEQPEVLTAEQYERMGALVQQIGLGRQRNPNQVCYNRTPVPFCTLCGTKRHTTPWEYRLTMKCHRRCAGTQCYCCVHAAKLLKVPRSTHILRKVPDILMVLLAVSRRERLRLQKNGDDECTCEECV
eukprot:s5_g19.t1